MARVAMRQRAAACGGTCVDAGDTELTLSNVKGDNIDGQGQLLHCSIRVALFDAQAFLLDALAK